ncbi:hypothetical protein ACLKA7_017520 [Drosophila subpalustris]
MKSGNILQQLENHVIFRSLHYTLIAVQLREELAKKKTTTNSGKNFKPFASWLNHVLLSYAGDILVNLLLGKLPLEPLGNWRDMALSTAAWFLIFHSPCDCGYAVARGGAFHLLATPITAISQVVHIEGSVQLAGRMYGPQAVVPILLVGTVVGSGAEFLKPLAALLINRGQATNVRLSTNCRASFCISCLCLLPLRQVHFCALITLISFKYLSLSYRWRLEHQSCYAFFGGLYADLAKFYKRLLKLA